MMSESKNQNNLDMKISPVNLYAMTLQVNDGTGRPLHRNFRPATDAEIMDAHPKCKVCMWLLHECHNDASPRVNDVIVDPHTDYCPHWKGLV